MKKVSIIVKGMHCKSCEVLIKDELEDQKGVGNIVVSFPKGKVSLRYDPKLISEEKIKAIIKQEGYDVM